jgi:hypothetical protein
LTNSALYERSAAVLTNRTAECQHRTHGDAGGGDREIVVHFISSLTSLNVIACLVNDL